MGYSHENFLRSAPALLKTMEREEDRKKVFTDTGTATGSAEPSEPLDPSQKPSVDNAQTQAGILQSIQQQQQQADNSSMHAALTPPGLQGLLGTDLLALRQESALATAHLRAPTGTSLGQPMHSSAAFSMQHQLAASLMAQQQNEERGRRPSNFLGVGGGSLGQAGLTESERLVLRIRQAEAQQQQRQLPDNTCNTAMAQLLAAEQHASSSDQLQSRLLLENSLARTDAPTAVSFPRQQIQPALSANPLFANILSGYSGLGLLASSTATSRNTDQDFQRWLLLREQQQQQQQNQLLQEQLRQQRQQQLQRLAQQEMLQRQRISSSLFSPSLAMPPSSERRPAPALPLAGQLMLLERDRVRQQQQQQQQQNQQDEERKDTE